MSRVTSVMSLQEKSLLPTVKIRR